MFVGDAFSYRRASLQIAPDLRFDHCEIFEILSVMRQPVHPDLVLSFAISPMFDCLDLAQLLLLNGFRGRQRFLANDIAAPRMICAEVRHACPELDFDILKQSDFYLA
ncbi:hypothetical protein [Oceaniglobus ichthyenteri]|uniref:hypothetical protein n=1 Tax=Oceaniglobus ichthyenteri TaxID=2136177 RepID=UPI000F831B48|nr:hypothetical protein [Oceaniglobus ichthyenteri]